MSWFETPTDNIELAVNYYNDLKTLLLEKEILLINQK